MLKPGVIGPGSITLVLWVIFLAGCGFLNNCFGIWPKLLINPIVAFFFKGSSILEEYNRDYKSQTIKYNWEKYCKISTTKSYL